jgi:hypothetical protein
MRALSKGDCLYYPAEIRRDRAAALRVAQPFVVRGNVEFAKVSGSRHYASTGQTIHMVMISMTQASVD